MDKDGNPKQQGCIACYKAITEGCSKEWDDGIRIYHDKSHPENSQVRRDADESTLCQERREAGKEVNFKPPSQVCTTTSTGRTHYYECAFIGEAELVKFTGLGHKALKLEMVRRQNEDGSGTSEGIYISFADLGPLPLNEVLALRRTRVWIDETQNHTQEILAPANQMCKNQGKNVFGLAREAEVRSRPSHLTSSGRDYLPTLTSLIDKANKIIEQRREKEALGSWHRYRTEKLPDLSLESQRYHVISCKFDDQLCEEQTRASRPVTSD